MTISSQDVLMPRIEGLALYQIVGEHADIVAPNARFGILPIHVRELVLVLMADDGTQGISVLPPSVDAATEASLGWLINTDPREVFVWEAGRVTGWDGEFAEQLAVCPPVDVALLDLCAKGAGCPLWALLGGRCRHEVPVYDSSVHFEDLVEPGTGVEAIAERARDAVQRGFRTVKVRVGRGFRWMPWPDSTDRDVEACRAVRKAVGPDVSIIVDASCGYAGYVEDAADFFAEVGDDGIGFATDMVALSEIGALRTALACRGIRLPLAAAPVLESPAVAEALLAHGAPDILETSPAQTGVVQWLQIARTAAARGAQVTCRSNGSHVGLHTGLHLATVAPHCAICEYPDVSYPDSLRSETVVHCGRVCAPSEPGLGIRAIDPRRG